MAALDAITQLGEMLATIGRMPANYIANANAYVAAANAVGANIPAIAQMMQGDAQRFLGNCGWATSALADSVKGPQIAAAMTTLGSTTQELSDRVTLITGVANQVLASTIQVAADVISVANQITATIPVPPATIAVFPVQSPTAPLGQAGA